MPTAIRVDRQQQSKLNADLPVNPFKKPKVKSKASKRNVTNHLDSVDENNKAAEFKVQDESNDDEVQS